MHKAAWGFHRRVNNSNKSLALFRREVEQPVAADRGRKWRINSVAEITWFSFIKHRRSCLLLSPQTLLQSSTVSYTCMTPLFHQELIYFFFIFHFCVYCILEVSTAPLARWESSRDPPLCSHIRFSWICKDFRGQTEKVRRNCGASRSDNCVHTCTSYVANTEEQRSSMHVWKQLKSDQHLTAFIHSPFIDAVTLLSNKALHCLQVPHSSPLSH